MKKVVIGLSGGVDSSVAAYLLKESGYEVIGLFMQNWHDADVTLQGDCSYEEDRIMAELVAKKLDIPFNYVDLSETYRKRIVDYMFNEYSKGRTPNPDVLCNREIKFDAFMDEALKLGADYVATGHYCQKSEEVINGETIYKLIAGSDNNKDQSYFLCQLSQKQLEKAMFPIGHIEKPEVREIAKKLGLATAQRKDSQGICFVGKVDLPTFLQQQLEANEGNIIEIDKTFKKYNRINRTTDKNILSKPFKYHPLDGKIVGKHVGAHFYTIGQRKGLNVGGTPEPLFIIGTDVKRNVVYVGQGKDHPGLYRPALFINREETHWVNHTFKLEPGESADYMVRIRYRQPLQKATLHCEEDGMYIVFEELQRGITEGQFAAWYNTDGELIGSGVING
ncbi:MAG: tRNA 2-thiouridine(34) synthase MnmA [Bacteroidales bacterium]|jgi:tRNA-specific 2-thiouridylase|nr:tRNA 2-thiouridine(34) synthase MnmA [Bacteroidales bacterium]